MGEWTLRLWCDRFGQWPIRTAQGLAFTDEQVRRIERIHALSTARLSEQQIRTALKKAP